MDNEFECVQCLREPYPDDINLWPYDYREAAFAAERVLVDAKKRKVISRKSQCINRIDFARSIDVPIDQVPMVLSFPWVLVYTVVLED
jgi:hypothetical protein